MKKLIIFYLEGCPYCRKAIKAMEELRNDNPLFEKAEIEWIEESENSAISDSYDYYRVPSIYLGEQKLYECAPNDDYSVIKDNIKKALLLSIK